MPHEHDVSPKNNHKLRHDEVADDQSPIRIYHEWSEAVMEHSHHEDETCVKKFQGHVVEVLERPEIEDYEHCWESKCQEEDYLHILLIAKIDHGDYYCDSVEEEPADIPFDVIFVLWETKVQTL